MDLVEPRKMTEAEVALVDETFREFHELDSARGTWNSHCQEVAELIWPEHANTFTFGNYNTPGAKKTSRQVDATGMLSLSRFAAICDSLNTPSNMEWHGLEASDPYVNKDRQSKLWFEEATRILFKYRYSPMANYTAQNQGVWKSLGAFGTGALFVDDFDGPQGGIRYRALPMGEWRLRTNHQNMVIGGIRYFRLTASQAASKWPREWLPGCILSALEKKNHTTLFAFFHRIWERKEDYDHRRPLNAKGKRFGSCYVSVEGRSLLQPESGYRSLPIATARYEQAPDESYGRGPAQAVLPSLKTLNAQKRSFLKQAHRAADPVLLTGDDGIVDFTLRPGALNKGGVNADGKAMVHVLPSGEIQVGEEAMTLEANIIKDAFLVSLFQILVETPTMTATEVMERTVEKGILLAPTVGRQGPDYVAHHIDRELDILIAQHLLPPMPPRLAEAEGEYKVVWKSPLARAARAAHASGFMRTVQMGNEIAAATGDASVFDPLDMDAGMRMVAEVNNVPESVMASDEAIAQKRQSRQNAQKRQEQIQAAPAQAALVKAQAVAAKAGASSEGPPAQ